MKKKAIILALLVGALATVSFSQSADSRVPALLDNLAAKAFQPSLLTAFGTFTFSDTGLPTPFSRYLQERLSASIASSKRLRFFNRDAAAAMDPTFLAMYGDFFKENSVDALLAGRYYSDRGGVRAHLELTSLATGELLGAADLDFDGAEIPGGVSVGPSQAALSTMQDLSKLVTSPADFKVSVSTERGPGAVYREGETMAVLMTATKESYVKVYHIDVNGVVQLIWPNRFDSGSGAIKPGQIVRIPAEGASFAFKMTPPFGTEFIKVVASTAPFADREADFADLRGDARSIITRGLQVKSVGAAKDAGERSESIASYVIVPRD